MKNRVINDPRHCRLIKELLKGPVSREAADKLAPTSNAPQYIMELRAIGIEIICIRRCFVDAEGFTRRPGTYHLTPEGRAAALHYLLAKEA